MRDLPYCETHSTDHHKSAAICMAELTTFVSSKERSGYMLIAVGVHVDEEALYYAEVTIEGPPRLMT